MNKSFNKDLTEWNTFGVTSTAKAYTLISQPEELIAVPNPDDVFILGGGSNLLLPAYLDKWVWHNGIEFIRADDFNNTIELKVGAGVDWHQLVTRCVNLGWCGIENLALIPGRVGAAPVQNIGAYGVEIKDVLKLVDAFHLESGKHVQFTNEDCLFSYRNSIFKQEAKSQYFITSITLLLHKDIQRVNVSYEALAQLLQNKRITQPTIRDVYQTVIEIRKSKLPDPHVLGNSGSFFKNPVVDKNKLEHLLIKFPNLKYYKLDNEAIKIPAGHLIESCGWKGKRIGAVGSYEKQALVIVNHGGATPKEVRRFVELVKQSVDERYGILLEEEVNIVPST